MAVFVHVPRTAGASLAAAFGQVGGGGVYRVAERLPFPEEAALQMAVDRYGGLEFAHRSQIKLLWGHIPFGIHGYLRRRCRYVGMLRDPIDRIVSLFHFAKNELHEGDRLYRPDLKLADWADDPPQEIDNAMTRYYCGLDAFQVLVGTLDAGHLERAKLNLSAQFAAVGVLEKYEEMLKACATAFGWEQRPEVFSQNLRAGQAQHAGEREPDRETMDVGLRRRFEEITRLDQELYDFAAGVTAELVFEPVPECEGDLDLSIILGTYNRGAHLTRCVKSMRRSVGNLTYEFIVCDAGSTDGSREWLAGQPDVVLLAEHVREGAVKAFNKAYGLARGRHVALMNDDVEAVDPGGLERAVHALQAPGVGQVALPFNREGERSFVTETVHGRPYANLGVISRRVADRIIRITGGLWSPCYRTYGADTELSCWIYRLGLDVVVEETARFADIHAKDGLRATNEKYANADSRMFWTRWPDPGMIRPNGPMPVVTGVELDNLRSETQRR
jgi:hypothetical protein